MAMGRYTFLRRLNEGTMYSTPHSSDKIFMGVLKGTISVTFKKLVENQRIDHIAAEHYGDGSYWWVIAAASGIGWSLQAPAGTILRIPIDLGQIMRIVR